MKMTFDIEEFNLVYGLILSFDEVETLASLIQKFIFWLLLPITLILMFAYSVKIKIKDV